MSSPGHTTTSYALGRAVRVVRPDGPTPILGQPSSAAGRTESLFESGLGFGTGPCCPRCRSTRALLADPSGGRVRRPWADLRWFDGLPPEAKASIRLRFTRPGRDAHLGAFQELSQHELALQGPGAFAFVCDRIGCERASVCSQRQVWRLLVHDHFAQVVVAAVANDPSLGLVRGIPG